MHGRSGCLGRIGEHGLVNRVKPPSAQAASRGNVGQTHSGAIATAQHKIILDIIEENKANAEVQTSILRQLWELLFSPGAEKVPALSSPCAQVCSAACTEHQLLSIIGFET